MSQWEDILNIIKAIEHPETRDCTLAERSFLRVLEGGCQIPIGVNSCIEGDQLTLIGMVASLDGKQLIKDSITGDRNKPEEIGSQLADKLKEQGADEILAAILKEIERN